MFYVNGLWWAHLFSPYNSIFFFQKIKRCHSDTEHRGRGGFLACVALDPHTQISHYLQYHSPFSPFVWWVSLIVTNMKQSCFASTVFPNIIKISFVKPKILPYCAILSSLGVLLLVSSKAVIIKCEPQTDYRRLMCHNLNALLEGNTCKMPLVYGFSLLRCTDSIHSPFGLCWALIIAKSTWWRKIADHIMYISFN